MVNRWIMKLQEDPDGRKGHEEREQIRDRENKKWQVYRRKWK